MTIQSPLSLVATALYSIGCIFGACGDETHSGTNENSSDNFNNCLQDLLTAVLNKVNIMGFSIFREHLENVFIIQIQDKDVIVSHAGVSKVLLATSDCEHIFLDMCFLTNNVNDTERPVTAVKFTILKESEDESFSRMNLSKSSYLNALFSQPNELTLLETSVEVEGSPAVPLISQEVKETFRTEFFMLYNVVNCQSVCDKCKNIINLIDYGRWTNDFGRAECYTCTFQVNPLPPDLILLINIRRIWYYMFYKQEIPPFEILQSITEGSDEGLRGALIKLLEDGILQVTEWPMKTFNLHEFEHGCGCLVPTIDGINAMNGGKPVKLECGRVNYVVFVPLAEKTIRGLKYRLEMRYIYLLKRCSFNEKLLRANFNQFQKSLSEPRLEVIDVENNSVEGYIPSERRSSCDRRRSFGRWGELARIASNRERHLQERSSRVVSPSPSIPRPTNKELESNGMSVPSRVPTNVEIEDAGGAIRLDQPSTVFSESADLLEGDVSFEESLLYLANVK